jgi:hypothetical protein
VCVCVCMCVCVCVCVYVCVCVCVCMCVCVCVCVCIIYIYICIADAKKFDSQCLCMKDIYELSPTTTHFTTDFTLQISLKNGEDPCDGVARLHSLDNDFAGESARARQRDRARVQCFCR